MLKGYPRHPQHSSDSEEQPESPQSENLQYQSEFHTFAIKNTEHYQHHRKHSSSQEEEDDSEEDQQNQQSHSGSEHHSDASSESSRGQNDESIEKIEARIRRLEHELSKKLQKISPERQVEKPEAEQTKKHNLKPKYVDSPLKPQQQKQDTKKQSISPKHKKLKSKEAGQSSNPHITTKQALKRANESYKTKTIEDKAPKATNSRKLTQSQQANSKEASSKHTISELKRQHQQLKVKVRSKPKKRSYLEKDIQDMDYLKSKIGSSEMTKLQKQIELLKILQSLRGKLKKSINHKLSRLYPDNDRNSNKSKIAAFLLHRGCSANDLS